MHLYIDESFRQGGKDGQRGAYVLAALAIYDRESRRGVDHAVNRAILALRTHTRLHSPPRFARLPEGRIRELKGALARDKTSFVPGLNDQPSLRDDFFRLLTMGARFRAYILYFDRPQAMKWMPKREQRRYGRLLQRLMAAVELVPSSPETLAITIDSQNVAWPALEQRHLLTWRKRRAGQRQQRMSDNARHRRWIQQINAVLDARYRGTPSKVWLVPSHLDRGLQAVDVIANFALRYQRLALHHPPYSHEPVSRAENEWFSGFEILASRIWWDHNPRLLKPKHVSRWHRKRLILESVPPKPNMARLKSLFERLSRAKNPSRADTSDS